MESDFRQGFIRGSSTKRSRPSELAVGRYDLVVLSSSWDKRCLSVTETDQLSSTHCGLFLLDVRDNLGFRDRHDPLLRTFSSQIAQKQHVILGSSRKIADLWGQLYDYVQAIYRELGRPLKLFIDLSTCPRYLSLGLTCSCLSSGMASNVSVFYAEGNYPEETTEETRHELFTTGGWDAVPIPGLEGAWSPGNKRTYVVSVGFEGTKTLRLISRQEPDDVYVLFPDPGVRPEYVVRAMKRNEALLRGLRNPEKDVIRANAGDAIEAWKNLALANPDGQEEQNVSYICCGTKPHSLALAVRAAVLKYPAVLYIIPDRHKVVDVEPLGVYWRFDFRDMTAI